MKLIIILGIVAVVHARPKSSTSKQHSKPSTLSFHQDTASEVGTFPILFLPQTGDDFKLPLVINPLEELTQLSQYTRRKPSDQFIYELIQTPELQQTNVAQDPARDPGGTTASPQVFTNPQPSLLNLVNSFFGLYYLFT